MKLACTFALIKQLFEGACKAIGVTQPKPPAMKRITDIMAPFSVVPEWVRLIRPKCITILYCNLTLFIDIFHFKVLFLCCFGLFYTVCNFPVPKQQNQDSAVKSGHQLAESDQLHMQ